MKKVVTFGEVMMRLATPGYQRFVQTDRFDVTFAGAEANVAAALAQFGVPVEFVTRLPDNDLGDACLNFLRRYGIGVEHIARGGGRLGVYYLETGAVQRPGKVIYDRADSALATIEPGMIDWPGVFADADWFHWTGITPAVSESAAAVCYEAAKCAKETGLEISCDLNYRGKLWKWGKSAAQVMPDLIEFCDLVVANEEDAGKVLGVEAPGVDVTAGRLDPDAYVPVCRTILERFQRLEGVAVTLRGSHSASHNTWSGMLYYGDKLYKAPVYDIVPIVDRVGGGDSFAGGLIYGLDAYGDPQRAIDFAVAASCLKHTIPGDFNLVGVADVEKLLCGDASGRVTR